MENNSYEYLVKRTEAVSLRFSKRELDLIDQLQSELQATNRWDKISRSDAIMTAIRFVKGEKQAIEHINKLNALKSIE